MVWNPYCGGVVWSRRFVCVCRRPSFLFGRDAEAPADYPCPSSRPACYGPLPHGTIPVRVVRVNDHGWREAIYRKAFSSREPLLNIVSFGTVAFQRLLVPAKTEEISFG